MNMSAPYGSLFAKMSSAGLSGLRDHMMSEPFAILPAHLESNQTQEARAEYNARQKQLKQLLRERGHGFIDTKGAWTKNAGEDVPLTIMENSVFISGIQVDEARELARRWEQQTVVLGRGGQYNVENLESGASWGHGDVNQTLHVMRSDETPETTSQIGDKQFSLGPANKAGERSALDGSVNKWCVYYVCSDPLPQTRLSGIMPLHEAQKLPVGALMAYVPFRVSN